MNLTLLDGSIALVFLVVLTFGGLFCRRYIKNAADWTVAGRNMGVFLGLSSGSAEGLGLISIAFIAERAFTDGWAFVHISIIGIVITGGLFGACGFMTNRFRQAKVVTVPEYSQRRYSKGLRITLGFILGTSGVLNMAIFPVIGSQFLVHYMGIPSTVSVFAVSVPVVPLMMGLLMALALLFAYCGGMVSVILTDFIQSVIIAFVVIIVTVLVIKDVSFTQLNECVVSNYGQGGFNPFRSQNIGVVFIIWIILQQFFGYAAFAPQMQRIAATDSPKTAQRMVLWAALFSQGKNLMIVFWGIGALAVLGFNAPEGMEPGLYTKVAGAIYLGKLLPIGLFGIALSGMVAAFISTVDSYLLTNATLLVNDVICPLCSKHPSPRVHIWLLRIMVALIAIFLYWFGFIYQPAESLFEWITVTGTMMLGSGIILIGGLYWKRGSTAGAYAAVISCCLIPFLNLILVRVLETYPIRSQDASLAGIILALILYVTVSLAFPEKHLIQKKGE